MSYDDEDIITKILRSKTVAVVGLSKDPSKASYEVAAYLQSNGYRIIPVNPTVDQVLGKKAYKSLLEIPEPLKREVDVVDIFRRPEDVPPIVDQSIELRKQYGRPSAVWMQLGIVNEEAARKALESGIEVVMDHCMRIEHMRRA